MIDISVSIDNTVQTYSAAQGESVSRFLERQGITLGKLDTTEPCLSCQITSEITITVTRIEESYVLVDEEIAFDEQIVQNESLGEGEEYLLQEGKNGIRQITYRVIKEDGLEKTRTIFSESILVEPTPKILMVGVSRPFVNISLPGKLAYLAAGNAWLMEGNTSERKPLTETNDLDGRILEISPDGRWLLYSRRGDVSEEDINQLWIASLDANPPVVQQLPAKNIIHHAAWVPGKTNTITYSTVEPRDMAPGWQANNDLWVLTFSEGGSVWRNELIIDANGGGEYGWWGADYFWSPDGNTLAFSRPDTVGYVDFQNKMLVPLFTFQGINTHGDWAWEPYIGWNPGSNVFLWQERASSVLDADLTIDLVSFSFRDNASYVIFTNTGLFSYPSPAPLTSNGHYYVAFLQAIQPSQSDTSRYKLLISDQDGSNLRTCFPPSDIAGLDPQRPVWAPDYANTSQLFVGVILDGNLWFVDAIKCEAIQVTSDGLITNFDWR